MSKFRYRLWGTDVCSDREIDITSDFIKKQLVMPKAMIDRVGTIITTEFTIYGGKVKAWPQMGGEEDFNEYCIEKGEPHREFYETHFFYSEEEIEE